MFISQVRNHDGRVLIVAREGPEAYVVRDASSTMDLVHEAIASGRSLSQTVLDHGFGAAVDLEAAYAEGRMMLPISHPDPAHCYLTGTGLTHLGSASTRASMHAGDGDEAVTDSMRMFRDGVAGGRPEAGAVGVQPEWFYKGSGDHAVAAGQALVSPSFALDGGEEPEVAGVYVIAPDGTPMRVGYVLANEFSDHVTERSNYLLLAHSKLRPASFGPELLVGALPEDVRGTSRILRDGAVIWEKPFLSGEANMSHTIANLEHHHFKYPLFRRPGDLHVHFFGTATLSFADGIVAQAGDVFEIDAPDFGLPLRNPLGAATESGEVAVVGAL